MGSAIYGRVFKVAFDMAVMMVMVAFSAINIFGTQESQNKNQNYLQIHQKKSFKNH